jgi:hypothetical protein
MTFNNKFDLQAVSYVGGLLISKFKNDCDECQKCLFAQNTDVKHIFTLYKEHDKSKLKLKYITEELCVCVAKIYDLSVYYLTIQLPFSRPIRFMKLVSTDQSRLF